MPTKVINIAAQGSYVAEIESAAAAIRAGRLVAFPTETVYGIAASVVDPGAVDRLRELRQSADTNPFTVHVGRRADARQFLSAPSPLMRRLTRKVWPGPVTIAYEEPDPADTEAARRYPERLDELYDGKTICLRCPDHPAAERLLTAAATPVVACGAAKPGTPPARDAESVRAAFGDALDVVIDGGRTRYGTPSTLIEVRGNRWSIQRAGTLDERHLQRLARSDLLFVCTGNSCRSPLAEFMARPRLAALLELSTDELDAAGFSIHSAGTAALSGAPTSAGTIEELRRRGIDARGHRSQPLTPELINRAERIYVMSPEHRGYVLDLSPSAANRVELLDPAGPISDPIGGGPEDYRRCATQIDRALDQRLREFLDEDRDWQ